LQGYVDNWFLISKVDDDSHSSRWDVLKSAFVKLGLFMHEEQISSSQAVNAIGWDWDTKSGLMICTLDKYDACASRLLDWNSRALNNLPFSSLEFEQLVGLLQWVCAACPVIVTSLAAMRAVTLKSNSPSSHSTYGIVLSPECKESVLFLHQFFTGWNRKCSLFAGFSPVCSWEVLIRCDASTDFGAGGFSLPSRECCIYPWSEEDRRLALSHSDEPGRESTTVCELLAILLLLRFFGERLRGKRVQFESDSEPAIRILSKCFSEKPACLFVVRKIRDLCASFNIIPRWEHILSSLNSIADSLSHNDFPQAVAHAKAELSLQLKPPSCPA